MSKVIDGWVNHYSGEGPLVLLESQSGTHKGGRFTWLAARPRASIRAYGNQIKIIDGEKTEHFSANPWDALSAFQKKHSDFLFGYLGYDLKNYNERLTSSNEDKIGAPDLFFMEPTVLFKFDHHKNRAEAIKGNLSDIEPDVTLTQDLEVEAVQSSIEQEDYIHQVNQIKNDIYEGEYYELNFTHQLCARFQGLSYRLYQKMRQAGRVPFGAYVEMDGLYVCCFSPERFLRKTGRKLISQPIKGTIKRGRTPGEDKALKARLQSSEKDRAENLMIVDLIRNDLSRVSRPGSVKVYHLFEIQSFATVHQMVSTISAVTDTENPVEIIQACFPMGSMTGAPKVKVMQAIEKYENYKRGIYSGAIGYITPDQDFDFNVVIRTAITKGGNLFYPAGGAITADSDPEAEWQESWLKAQGLIQMASSIC